MRTARPLVTWSMMTEYGPSATSLAISSPRLSGPGGRMMTSRFARRTAASVRQKYWAYSSRLGQETWRARKWQVPEDGWRTTMASGRMASRLRAVSASVSPLLALEVEALMLTVSADSRLAAISKDVRVRVLAS